MQLGVEPYLGARQACAEGQKTEKLLPEILDASACLYSIPRFPDFMLKLGGAPMGKGSSKGLCASSVLTSACLLAS
jgi:hypothetical protein